MSHERCSICGVWGQKTRECCGSKDSEASTPSLGVFSDKELQAELRKRKAHAKTAEERERLKRIHNTPVQKEIDILEREVVRLKNKLK